MKTGTRVLWLICWNMFHYFWMITWIKNANNFQIVKIQPHGVASICLAFLIKVLPI